MALEVMGVVLAMAVPVELSATQRGVEVGEGVKPGEMVVTDLQVMTDIMEAEAGEALEVKGIASA
jgi:hypothetical protein